MFSPDGTTEPLTWRFYAGEDGLWRWQQLAVNQTVVAQSRTSYASYDSCIAAAQASGYQFAQAQERIRR
jgi:uncharacterized protein YegP (UPF0339 family)